MNRWWIRNIRHGFVLVTLYSLATMPVVSAEKPKTPIENGRALALNLCQACHSFPGANQAGTVGPPFISMSQRFLKRDRLRDIIYDPQKAIKPHTMMPPFGRHAFMDNKETELLIDFLYTL